MNSNSPTAASGRVERFETVVIGAGQAGLAVGHYLSARDIDFIIVSDEARVGDNWRRRWDSLRLFTPAGHSGLPGMPFPAPPGHFPDKDDVAEYLERYATRFDLPVRLDTRVRSLSTHGARYILRVDGRSSVIEADSVVIATGAFQRPHVAPIAERVSPTIHQLHSSAYQNPLDLPEGSVLVVGAGNSGAQIAIELARFRKVWLAGRNTGYFPRRLLGRDLFDWASPLMARATTETRLGRRMQARGRRGGDALIGIPERELAKAGIVRVGRLTAERGGLPVCGDMVLDPRVIVWCTGYAPDYGWVDLPVFNDDGSPRCTRGIVANAPGLFFVGLRFQHRMTSSLIGGVGDDAAFIVEQIVRRSESLMPA